MHHKIDMEIQNGTEIEICCICLEENTDKSIEMPCCKNSIHTECLFQILVTTLPVIKKCALCRTNINKEVFSIEQIMSILDSTDSVEHTKIYVNTYLKSSSIRTNTFLNSIRRNTVFQLLYLTILMFIVIAIFLIIYTNL